MEKLCNICKLNKPILDFYVRKTGQVDYCCKKCHNDNRNHSEETKQKNLKRSLIWQQNNKDRRKIIKQKWVDKNLDYQKEYYKKMILEDPEYNKKNYWNNPELFREYSRKFRKNNPKYSQNYIKKKLKTDINFRLASNMRQRIVYALKQSKTKKETRTTILLGCPILELKNHLESMFSPTMTWKNYGPLWHVDHIIPCSKFDLKIEEEQKKCFHYTNLQPLFAITTIINGIEYIGNFNKNNRLL